MKKNILSALRENRSEANMLAVKEELFNAQVMYKELVYLSGEETRAHESSVPTSVRALAKSHKIQRGLDGRDNLVQAFLSIAHRDNQRLAQRDQYRAYRAAKKEENRLAAIR